MNEGVFPGITSMRVGRLFRTGGRSAVLRLGLLLSLTLVVNGQLSAASPRSTNIDLGEGRGSIEIARCHLDEGRIVVRYN